MNARGYITTALITALSVSVSFNNHTEGQIIEEVKPDNTERLIKKEVLEHKSQRSNEIREIASVFEKANPDVPHHVHRMVAATILDEADDVFTVDLIMALLFSESSFRYDAVSEYDARGVAQIQPTTGEWIANKLGFEWDERKLFDPSYNIKLGLAYLRWLYVYCEGDIHRTLTAYNRGIAGAGEYFAENGTFESEYSRKIINLGGKTAWWKDN